VCIIASTRGLGKRLRAEAGGRLGAMVGKAAADIVP
jgi:hypothetical protein